ncbi:MAG: hypothetical protein MJ119_02330 [Lachnospiraceae bacterium]|nr:hypothetical protein [Lachnospiraceae bacterium]
MEKDSGKIKNQKIKRNSENYIDNLRKRDYNSDIIKVQIENFRKRGTVHWGF